MDFHLTQDKERPARQDLRGHLLGHRTARYFVVTSVMAVGKFVQEDTAGSDGLRETLADPTSVVGASELKMGWGQG